MGDTLFYTNLIGFCIFMFPRVVRYNYEVGRQDPWQGCMLICIGLLPCGNMGEWFNCHGKTPGLYKDKIPLEFGCFTAMST